MSKIIIYHGSEKIIEQPAFGAGSQRNDYGRGFYCTESEELAKEWACSKNNNGFANKYELDTDGLSMLNLNSKEYNILNWLAVLTSNRTYWENSAISETAKDYLRQNFMVDTSGYDIITGYRADDSYFSFAQDFVSGAISYQKLSEAMRLGKLGEQIVLMSKKAFDSVKFIDAIPAESNIYFPKKNQRDRAARKEYRQRKKQTADVSELYIIDIMREEIKQNDPRLF